MDVEATLLRDKGLRSTPQRRAVLHAIAGKAHVTAADIAATVASAGSAPGSVAVGELSRQGLYNILDDLRRVGLVRVIEPAGSPALFELHHGDNHHHMVCRGCGRVRDVPCAVGAAPCLDAGVTEDFTVDEAEVIWWGRCGACSRG